MGLFSRKIQRAEDDIDAEFKEKQSMLNGRELKKLLTIFKENRDEIEKQYPRARDLT